MGKLFVGAKSTVIFEYNLVYENGGGGGALLIKNGTLNIDKDACVRFSHNSVGTNGLGGAVWLHIDGQLIVNNNASLIFINNSAIRGRAACLLRKKFNDTCRRRLCHFYNNNGSRGGAVYLRYGTMLMDMLHLIQILHKFRVVLFI